MAFNAHPRFSRSWWGRTRRFAWLWGRWLWYWLLGATLVALALYIGYSIVLFIHDLFV